MNSYTIRDARPSDIDDIFRLGSLLNTLNMPANKHELEYVIDSSDKSFSLQESNFHNRSFLFVLTDPSDRVIGTSQIFAKHGTLAVPHHFFQVGQNERYSVTLGKYFRHVTLRLCQSFDGPSEIGSLVLDKSYRNHSEKLGTLLSYTRFLFIAMKPEYFADTFLAELLPPLGPDFDSALWNAVGFRFTGLPYYEADMISRNNKEFIKTLFPSSEIYVSILPKDAQEVIGKVGENSKGAAHLLSKIGFRYAHRVDPFDGGPHFEANREDISILREAIHGHALGGLCPDKEAENPLGLCGRFLPDRPSGDRFRAVVSKFHIEQGGNIQIPKHSASCLTMSDGEMSIIRLI